METPEKQKELRSGWTTGACATAALKAALLKFWTGEMPESSEIELPRGQKPKFEIAHADSGEGWAEAGIIKDAGDDPDVTHGALITVRVEAGDKGVTFKAGKGVGVVTKAGLPIEVGEPAINPIPRQMMTDTVSDLAEYLGKSKDIVVTISVPNGEELAAKTWNGRLGIEGGLSILGTTGIVRPFSCSAWIASIHRGVDVARANGVHHVAGCTGATSEKAVRELLGLPVHAMLDMGDFYGGLMKYLRVNPVQRVTIGGGIGKITKLAQGARDLHSKRSQVDFETLSGWLEDEGLEAVRDANTALEAFQRNGAPMAEIVAVKALDQIKLFLGDVSIEAGVVITDRAGKIVARAGV